MVKYAAAMGVAALLILAWVPDCDLACARLFYAGGGYFIGNTPIGVVARDIAKLVPLLLFVGLLLLHVGARTGLVAASHAPDVRGMLFLTLSLALGPGLLVNMLKDEMHRPRPTHLRDFGGRLAFAPFYSPDGGCPRNCSFPSGEAAAAFWTVAPASLAAGPLRPVLLALALLFGLATGGLRMASGGHFLSDIISAGILTLSVNAALRWVPLLSAPPSRAENSRSRCQ